ALTRVTTRVEDIAYCLLRIFDVHISILYSEGDKAFIRRQEEIMKHSDDHSLFRWTEPKLENSPDSKPTYFKKRSLAPSRHIGLRGLLAKLSADFSSAKTIVPSQRWVLKSE
ncbi:hypothetical protein CC78DRAFT_462823, partial [Lojkania enalia]